MSKYQHYLFDLGLIVKERALQARGEAEKARGTDDHDFEDGRVLAFNEVISIMQQQAEGFEIPLSELRLDDIVPDRDLT